MVRCIWTFVWVGLFAVMGCDQPAVDRSPDKITSEDVRRDAGQAVKTTAEYSQQIKDEFVQKLEARLKEMDAEIIRLRAKGGDLNDEAKATWVKQMAELEAQRNAASAKLAEVHESGAEAWKDVQNGTLSAWDELDKAVRDAARKF